MSKSQQNVLQNHASSLPHDLKQQQQQQEEVSFSTKSTDMCETTEDDQYLAQATKPVNKREDAESTLEYFHNSSVSEAPSGFFSYGVDWSTCAKPTSHCWLPYSPKNSSTSRLCAYISCKNYKSTSDSPLIQCPTCLLIVHATHIVEVQEATTNSDDAIPPCRPSFTDNNTADNINLHDQHYWSYVRTLSTPCIYCKRKSLKNTPYYNDNPTTTYVERNTSDKHSEPSSGLVCMWCSRNYHKKCWENIKDNGDNSKCDYGKFGDIIVRPQWLCRVTDSSSHFRAYMPDDFEMNDKFLTPVIFFINKLSGGQQGQQIYRILLQLLNPRQVFLLENDSIITEALKIYASLSNIRICMCGGDGTVGWVLRHLADTFPSLKNPPASICPLGTGNDLSRVLGWGYQYTSRLLFETLKQINHAQPIALDRWKIQIEPLEPNISSNESANTRRRFFLFGEHPKFLRGADLPLYDNHRTPINTFFFNYISFGLDAAVILDFHAHRTLDPSKFTSPFKNKLLFINESRKYFNDFTFGITWKLSSYIRLICDGQDITDSLPQCHSLVILNTRGYGSGTSPWGKISMNKLSSSSTGHLDSEYLIQPSSSHSSVAHNAHIDTNEIDQGAATSVHAVSEFEAQDLGDGKIEILGLNTIQMALIHIGFRGTRIAQCREVRIELSHPMPVHMDGEPFYLATSTAVNITHAGQVMVLRNEKR